MVNIKAKNLIRVAYAYLIGVAYLRVSSEDRAIDKLGIDAQKRDIMEAAAKHGIRIRKFYVEKKAINSKVPLHKRELLLEMIESLKEGEVVMVSKTCRLARPIGQKLAILEHIRWAGAKLLSADGQGTTLGNPKPSDYLQFMMTSVIDDYERLKGSDNTTKALKTKQLRGERTGGLRYGYKEVNGKLVENEREQEIIKLVLKLRGQRLSYDKIAAYLDENGHETRKGNSWSTGSIQCIINRQEKE